MTMKEFRRATATEIDQAKKWVLANTPVHAKNFDPTSVPEYAQALEIIIFANGGRYADPDTKIASPAFPTVTIHTADGDVTVPCEPVGELIRIGLPEQLTTNHHQN
jgi:hypothetical protein